MVEQKEPGMSKQEIEVIKYKEWLLTNGLGGYASSTISGMNSRRYHGLLVASKIPPTARKVLVSKIDETILGSNGDIPLGTNQYPGLYYPEGYKYLTQFKRDPFPVMTFKAGDWKLKKTVFMVYGSNTTVVEYHNLSKRAIKLRLTPLLVDRDFHALSREDSRFDYYNERKGDVLRVHSEYGSDPLFIKYTSGSFESNHRWNKNIEYHIEQFRGQDYSEDTCEIGHIYCEINPKESAFVLFSTDEKTIKKQPVKLKEAESKRLDALSGSEINNSYYRDLLKSADQFIVKRASVNSYTILAGYHWFADWGRDSMIALLGYISMGKKKECQSIITTFLKHLSEGMLPNRFPDYEGDEPEYNTVDATLWLFIVIYEFDQKFDDKKLLKEAFTSFDEIINWYVKGTRYKIHVNEEGLVSAGDSQTQLTWMDARIGDYAVTPRFGCPVEINALWYNALCIYELLASKLKLKHSPDISDLKNKVHENFNRYFVNENGSLNDLVVNGKGDNSIRPNQIYAISLPFSPVSKKIGNAILKCVKEELLTSCGLRSLSVGNPEFRPFYGGNQWDRDTAYHQGTIWPFLVGEYMMALLKVKGFSAQSKKEVKGIIDGFKDHFYDDACIHGISEIFDGEDPKRGKGCIHQAWSVTQLIRVLIMAKII